MLFRSLKGGTAASGIVVKEPGVNFMFFSIKKGSVFPTEPSKQSYDLIFTQYTTLLFTDKGIPYPYLVTGVLLNRFNVEVSVDSTAGFSGITREKALTMSYTKSMDAIGYDWKFYNFTTGVYTIRPNLNFVIRSISGLHFKLRFVGFYNKDGLKGYPIVEYQML